MKSTQNAMLSNESLTVISVMGELVFLSSYPLCDWSQTPSVFTKRCSHFEFTNTWKSGANMQNKDVYIVANGYNEQKTYSIPLCK